MPEEIEKPSNFDTLIGLSNAWAKGGAGAIGSAASHWFDNIKELMRTGPVHPSDITTDYAKKALQAGPLTLSPLFGRAVGGLGATGGRILQRTDAQKLIREMAAQKKSGKEIAEAINERFAPILDKGESVSTRQIYAQPGGPKRFTPMNELAPQTVNSPWKKEVFEELKVLQNHPNKYSYEDIADKLHDKFGGNFTRNMVASKINNRKDQLVSQQKEYSYNPKTKELGVMGSSGVGGRVTEADVIKWAQEAKVPIQVDKTADGATTYIKFQPENPARNVSEVPVVRLPSDAHAGKAIKDKEVGNVFDTGTLQAQGFPPDPRATTNISGQSYSKPEALEAALNLRLSKGTDGNFLVSPDYAPVAVMPKELPIPNVGVDKNQLKLDLNAPRIPPNKDLEGLPELFGAPLPDPKPGMFGGPSFAQQKIMDKDTDAMVNALRNLWLRDPTKGFPQK